MHIHTCTNMYPHLCIHTNMHTCTHTNKRLEPCAREGRNLSLPSNHEQSQRDTILILSTKQVLWECAGIWGCAINQFSMEFMTQKKIKNYFPEASNAVINEEAKQYWFVSHGQILAPMDEARARCSVQPWCLQCEECRTLSFIYHVSQCTVNFPGQQTLIKPRHVNLWWPFRRSSVLTPGQERGGCAWKRCGIFLEKGPFRPLHPLEERGGDEVPCCVLRQRRRGRVGELGLPFILLSTKGNKYFWLLIESSWFP